MVTRTEDMRVCVDCHGAFNKNEQWFEGERCESCQEKKNKAPSKFDTDNWIRYIQKLQNRDWSYDQLNCPEHSFMILPKSGKYLGIPLWRCLRCDGVVQSI